MSLTKCLKKLGLSKHEAAILRGSQAEYLQDGVPAQQAAINAVQERLDDLTVQREKVLAEIKDAGGPVQVEVAPKTEIDKAAAQAEGHKASEDQQDAGNYQKGHVVFSPGTPLAMEVSFENRAGTRRRPEWPPLQDHYGYFKGTIGFDKDHLDVFVKPGTTPEFKGTVYVVNQDKAGGAFDEHKALMGWTTPEEALAGYLRNYEQGWDNYRSIVPMSMAGFKEWAHDESKAGPRGGALTAADAQARDLSAADRGDQPDGGAAAQRDLFDTRPLPSSQARLLERTVVEVEKQRSVKLPAGRIRTVEDAATAFAQLNRWPRERFQMIGVDDRGKPIAFYDLFSGTLTQTSVYPREVWTALYQTPGVTGVWLAHNHPSGVAQPSQADELLTRNIGQMLGPQHGIRLHGHVVIAGDKGYAIGLGPIEVRTPAEGDKMRSVPVMERVIRKSGPPGDALTSPWAVRDFLRKLDPKEDGMLLLDAQHRVQGWWPMDMKRVDHLMPGNLALGTAEIMRAIGRNNMAAAIIYAPTVTDMQQLERASRNLKEILGAAEVKVLDAFMQNTADPAGQMLSFAERGCCRTGQGTSSTSRARTRSPASCRERSPPVRARSAACWTR